jgi:hypothetical protein
MNYKFSKRYSAILAYTRVHYSIKICDFQNCMYKLENMSLIKFILVNKGKISFVVVVYGLQWGYKGCSC